MSRRKNARKPEPAEDRPNPVVGWRGIDGMRQSLKRKPDETKLFLFAGPRSAADRAAGDFAKELGNPVHEVPRSRRPEPERSSIEEVIGEVQSDLGFDRPSREGLPILLMPGLGGYSESAMLAVKHYAETGKGRPFICIGTVESLEDLPDYVYSHFLVAHAEYKSGRPKKTI